MIATQHPTRENHWLVNETQTVQQTSTDDEGNEVTTDVEVVVAQHLVACKADDSSAERAIAILNEAQNPTGDIGE
tara:strand:+ start:317 stop:541 length:225 start_codon:yes stop_codon:yes gene_type:complete